MAHKIHITDLAICKWSVMSHRIGNDWMIERRRSEELRSDALSWSMHLDKVPMWFMHLDKVPMWRVILDKCTQLKQQRWNINSAMPFDCRIDSKLFHKDYNY